jgi:phosphate transport system substrate-binding protein
MRFAKLIFSASIILMGCGSQNTKAPMDTTNEGTIRISVEESFKPIIEQQLKVFHASFPKAQIIASYKSEIECFKDFASDSTRMIITTRGLRHEEEEVMKSHLGFTPTYGILAYNAVAVVIAKNARDSVFSMQDLSHILTGKNPKEALMDGNNLTGIIRFLKDSLVKQNALGKNVQAAKGSEEVIKYIQNNPNAIGFVGMNWVGDTYDPKQVAYQNQIKMGLVECTLCIEKGYFSKPSQSTISQGQYSLSLPIYYNLKENAPGLGSGFLNFLSEERGQLIFRRAFLVPAKMSFKNRKGMMS